MLEKFKQKYIQKEKLKKEESIKKRTLFNEWRIEQYQKYTEKIEPPLEEFRDDIGICYWTEEEDWAYYKKYFVNKELFDRFLLSCKTATEEYNKMEIKIKQEKLEKEQREKIDLYKKAILELKEEGKI